MFVKSFAFASIKSAYTDSEDEIDDCTQDNHQDRSSIHAIIPQSFQKSNSLTLKHVSMKEELVLDDNFDEDNFRILPTSADQYPPELQERFNNYLKVSESSNLDFNSVMQNRKSFRNPSMYEKLVHHCGLDESGTNFSPEVFDPFKWDKEAYYDQLDIAQQKFMSQLEKSKTQQLKVEIVSGMTKHPSPAGILVNKNNSSNVHNFTDCNNNNNNNSTQFLDTKNYRSKEIKCEFNVINFNFKRPRR